MEHGMTDMTQTILTTRLQVDESERAGKAIVMSQHEKMIGPAVW